MDRKWQARQAALGGLVIGGLLAIGAVGPHMSQTGVTWHPDGHAVEAGTFVSAFEAEYLGDKVAIAQATAAVDGVPVLTESERLEWSEDEAVGDFGDVGPEVPVLGDDRPCVTEVLDVAEDEIAVPAYSEVMDVTPVPGGLSVTFCAT